MHGDLGLDGEGLADALQNQNIVAPDAAVIGCIREFESEHAEIGEVLPVDVGE